MAQEHLDRLSGVDAAFLAQEGASTHMHIGGVATLEGPAPSYEDFLAHIEGRLHLVPRYRQKPAVPPLGAGRPVWIDDPKFNLEYHVRQTGLPKPGSEDLLWRTCARIFSQQLDRNKPLWELWLVEGLQGGRFALISKTHHSLVDGVSGVDLMAMLFDVSREGRDEPGAEEWLPRPEPSPAELLAHAVQGRVRDVAGLAGRAVTGATNPGRVLGQAREVAEGIGEVAWAGLNRTPETPLNRTIGPHRRFAVVRSRLDDFKAVKDALGGTVNDVVLAVVAGGLRHFFHQRGLRTAGVELRAAVPVSVRAEQDAGALGNRLTQMLAPLPLDVADARQRLEAVRRAMEGVKHSKQALGAEAIATMEEFAPPTLFAQASRLNFATRFYNLLVTNVPGPQFPLYVLGREMESVFPVAFLAGDRALAVAAMSYNGGVNFGLIGDYDAMPDVDVVAEGIRRSLDELLELSRGRATVADGRPAARRRPATRRPARRPTRRPRANP